MAVTGPVTEVLRAAGDHVPGLLVRVEERLAELAADHGATLAEHAGATIAAGGKRLRPPRFLGLRDDTAARAVVRER